jgi:N6-adenosine-specific RNA methylase IME4
MTDLASLFGLVKGHDTAYSCILADPPWEERGGGKITRGAQRHYPLLKTRDIPGVMQRSPMWNPAEDGHLWLWSTNNYLEDGLWVMKTLGYRYITNAVWVKDRVGLGQYMRGQHELLLFGVRGKALVPKPENRPPTVIQAPRQQHSHKPDEFYQLVETISPGPYLEIFARRDRPGWDSWGNEETMENERQA